LRGLRAAVGWQRQANFTAGLRELNKLLEAEGAK
jgi:hypothetical protein